MMNLKYTLLRNTSIFSSLDDKALEVIFSDAAIVTVAPGDYFFRQWEQGRCMYVLENGHCRVHISWTNREVQLSRLGPGDCFGEIALIDSSPRSASVQADTLCTAIEISSTNLKKLRGLYLEQYVIVQENIAKELCKRLRSADVNRMMMAESRTGNVDIELPWP